MPKIFVHLLLLLLLSLYSPLKNDFSNYIKLNDFTKTKFSLDNEFVIFQYENKYNYSFKYEINFILDEGYKSSTKVFFYDSFEKIKRDDTGFINYVGSTTLKETREIKILYNDTFYKNQTTYYIVLYDISNTYTDFVYTLNSLEYLPLKSQFYYRNTLKHELHFNFLIHENNLKYLHYQTSIESGSLIYPTTYFRLTNEKGEKFIDQNCYGISGYAKIEPNVKYYFEVTIYKETYFNEKHFMLSLDNFRENILLEKGKEIKTNILFPQNLTYFKNISDLSINETLYFKFYALPSRFHYEDFYIKFYESDNYSKLENLFPKEKEDYDDKIGHLSNGGNFTYELKKKYKSQKGVLIGVFFTRDYMLSMDPTYISARVIDEKEKKEEEKEEEEEKEDQGEQKNNSSVIGIIIGVIVFILAIIGCYYGVKSGKCSSNNSYSSSNSNEDNESEYDIIAIKRRH